MSSQRIGIVVGLAWASMCLGCSGADPLARQPVSGTVTFDGASLPIGSITFVPVTGDGYGSGSAIQDGAYNIPRDKGLPPGEYQVQVYAPSEVASASAESVPSGVLKDPKELIPSKYNLKTELRANVVAGQSNVFDFDLTAK